MIDRVQTFVERLGLADFRNQGEFGKPTARLPRRSSGSSLCSGRLPRNRRSLRPIDRRKVDDHPGAQVGQYVSLKIDLTRDPDRLGHLVREMATTAPSGRNLLDRLHELAGAHRQRANDRPRRATRAACFSRTSNRRKRPAQAFAARARRAVSPTSRRRVEAPAEIDPLNTIIRVEIAEISRDIRFPFRRSWPSRQRRCRTGWNSRQTWQAPRTWGDRGVGDLPSRVAMIASTHRWDLEEPMTRSSFSAHQTHAPYPEPSRLFRPAALVRR